MDHQAGADHPITVHADEQRRPDVSTARRRWRQWQPLRDMRQYRFLDECGVTTDLLQRGLDHREGCFEGFAKKYGCKTLVWWEQHDDHHTAIKRETQIKWWKREWKLALIEKDNPTWRDLYDDLLLPRHLRKDDPN